MKLNKFFMLISVVIISGSFVQAQEVTDDELKKYVITMDSINGMTDRLKETYNKISGGNEKISNARYNQLVGIISDTVKLGMANATSEEITYIKKGEATKKEEAANVQKSCNALINDYVGSVLFVKVRNALKTDAELRKKYDALLSKPE